MKNIDSAYSITNGMTVRLHRHNLNLILSVKFSEAPKQVWNDRDEMARKLRDGHEYDELAYLLEHFVSNGLIALHPQEDPAKFNIVYTETEDNAVISYVWEVQPGALQSILDRGHAVFHRYDAGKLRPCYVIEMRMPGSSTWERIEEGNMTYNCAVAANNKAKRLAAQLAAEDKSFTVEGILALMRITDISGHSGDMPHTACPNFEPKTRDIPGFIAGMDWKLLRKQKRALVRLTASDSPKLDDAAQEALEGILNGLDAIQDYAVDEAGLDDALVFGERDADGYHIEEDD